MDKNSKLISEKLERRIVHGLSCEWRAALYMLEPEFRSRMRIPLFCLSDVKKRLGCWSTEKREISLSRSFVLNHPWDSVREVLLHEMAHQFAIEVLNAHDEPAHGSKFKEACHLLRANPKASGNYKTIRDEIVEGSSGSEDRIMLRIQKLMALAESSNHHEADAAMAKSRELIKKYNINLLQTNQKKDYKTFFIGTPSLRHFREEYHLADLLVTFYFVQGIWVPAYVVSKGKMGKVLEISGTPKNLKIAEYVYEFVKHFISSRWKEYNKGKGYNRYRKTDFSVGIISGFRQKLEKQDRDGKISKRYSLVEVNDPRLQAYFDYRYPHTKRLTRQSSMRHDEIMADGVAMGRKMVISKGIVESSPDRLFLLEGLVRP